MLTLQSKAHNNQRKNRIIGTSVDFVMKYFKHYTEWAVSHPVLSRLGKLFKNEMSQKSGKSPRGDGQQVHNSKCRLFGDEGGVGT